MDRCEFESNPVQDSQSYIETLSRKAKGDGGGRERGMWGAASSGHLGQDSRSYLEKEDPLPGEAQAPTGGSDSCLPALHLRLGSSQLHSAGRLA